VAFDDDNPVAVQVADPGGASGPFSLTAYVTEKQPDLPADGVSGVAPGDISRAAVTMALVPVGPGSPIPGSCATSVDTTIGYAGELTLVCDFDDVPVNTYSVEVTVGGGYYAEVAEDVLVVFDPSLGFTTGGGWFNWPGTAEKTKFGYTMKYHKKGQRVKGSLLLIRHVAPGENYGVKSNALYGLSLGKSTSPDFGWASFSGKCTYKDEDSVDPEGNHVFLVYVEDHGEPGQGVDQFWIEVRDKDGNVITVMSMGRPATDWTETLGGGNIVVPHTRR
jgi:hypothetical protein